jgi:hypothetical protein
MNEYILKQLLEIERELVVGDEKNVAPKTLDRVRKLSSAISIKLNQEREKQMIAEAVECEQTP